MHNTAYTAVKTAFDRIDPKPKKVVDIGSFDVNGTLKPIFDGLEYTGLDIAAGPNVDVVLSNPFKFPFEDGTQELVVSANCLEHVSMPWIWAVELDRILEVGGHVILQTPWQIHYHNPPDYWRLSHEAMKILFDVWIPSRRGSTYEILQNTILGMDTVFFARKTK